MVEIRAEAIQIALDCTDSGAIDVRCTPAADLRLACEQAKDYCKNEKGIADAECAISAYLYPSQKIVAGHKQALQWIEENKKKFGLLSVKPRQQKNAVFHCGLMQSVVKPIREVLDHIDISDPIINVYSNVDGQRYGDAAHIRKKLPKQIVSPIKWEQTIHIMYARGNVNYPRTFSCGLGSEIMWLLKRNNAKAWDSAVRTKRL